ncbi:peptidoglycan-associated lipoprotein Pal [Pseudobowmanella zhangzhouensis]|uniref:peptidoglycan-associated lipoprotein Pal n=1 Tax=Pseudobowmanella zhangzhouensis TaxID=1537679 RepID=UPI0036197565
MQFNKVVKGLIIALPVMTLMACGSSGTAEDQAAEMNKPAVEENAQASAGVETAAPDAARLERERQEQQMKDEMMALQNLQTVYFDFDRSTIRSEFYGLLDKHAAFLVKNSGVSIVIEGHTDERGTPEYNISLGESRAKSVATYLQNGVSASQMSVVSYGEEKPVDSAATEAAWAKNRRAVLVYQK